MIKICLNCGNEFNAKSNGAKYCDDCKNGKIYMKGHENEEYGELKINAVYRYKNKQYAECVCYCGKYCEIRYDSLKDGRVVSCGHVGAKNLFEKENLSGKINKNGIKIIYRKKEKKNGCYIYCCLCKCGKEFDITSNNFSNAISCGHAKEESEKNNIKCAKNEYDKYSLNGTNALVLSSKIPKNNNSGSKGVRWDKDREKWVAEIVFKGKRYHLGRYYTVEDASKVRKIAEEHTHKDFLKWFADEFPLLYKRISDKVDEKEESDLERIREIKNRNRKNREWILEYNCQKKTLVQWCSELGMNYDCIRQRICKLGWSVEKAFETPFKKRNS